jgi:hypothetical protein
LLSSDCAKIAIQPNNPGHASEERRTQARDGEGHARHAGRLARESKQVRERLRELALETNLERLDHRLIEPRLSETRAYEQQALAAS